MKVLWMQMIDLHTLFSDLYIHYIVILCNLYCLLLGSNYNDKYVTM